jgi:hypothetical protein
MQRRHSPCIGEYLRYDVSPTVVETPSPLNNNARYCCHVAVEWFPAVTWQRVIKSTRPPRWARPACLPRLSSPRSPQATRTERGSPKCESNGISPLAVWAANVYRSVPHGWATQYHRIRCEGPRVVPVKQILGTLQAKTKTQVETKPRRRWPRSWLVLQISEISVTSDW